MADVRRQARLHLRNGIFYYRVRVPADLRDALGRTEIWTSLGTRDRKAAEVAARREAVKSDRQFAFARAHLQSAKAAADEREPSHSRRKLQAPTPEAITAAVRRYFYDLEQNRPPLPIRASALSELHQAAIEEAALVHTLPEEGDGSIQRIARRIAGEAGIDLGNDHNAFLEMVAATKRALNDHMARTVDFTGLNPVANSDPLFADIDARSPPPERMTLRAAITAFHNDPGRQSLSRKTKEAYRFRLAVWEELLGPDTLLSNISRTRINDARDVLINLPPNASKRWPGVNLREVAKMAKAQGFPPMHPKNMRHYADYFSALMNWLVKEGELTANPAVGISVPSPSGEKSRRPFQVPELNSLFAAPPYAGSTESEDWRWWGPLIGLFEGLRLAEIVGLEAGDIQKIDGTDVIMVRPNAERGLKTQQSERVVPIHPKLVELGFLDFVRTRPATGPLWVLPDACDKVDAVQKAFAYSIRKLFPDDRRLVFHSFRHTWADAMRAAFVNRDIIERLGGWKAQGSAFVGYGDGYRPSLLAVEIAKVDYPELDLNCCNWVGGRKSKT